MRRGCSRCCTVGVPRPSQSGQGCSGEFAGNLSMCNLYSITTNQAAIIALFRVVNRYVGNLPPMPGVFPDYPARVVRNTDTGRELTTMRWGMPPPPKFGGPPVTNHNGGSASALEPRIP